MPTCNPKAENPRCTICHRRRRLVHLPAFGKAVASAGSECGQDRKSPSKRSHEGRIAASGVGSRALVMPKADATTTNISRPMHPLSSRCLLRSHGQLVPKRTASDPTTQRSLATSCGVPNSYAPTVSMPQAPLSRLSPWLLLLLAAPSRAVVGESPGGTGAPASGPPNIVMFLVDDLGYANVGWTRPDKSPEVQTPTMDSLVTEGLELTRFYVRCRARLHFSALKHRPGVGHRP